MSWLLSLLNLLKLWTNRSYQNDALSPCPCPTDFEIKLYIYTWVVKSHGWGWTILRPNNRLYIQSFQLTDFYGRHNCKHFEPWGRFKSLGRFLLFWKTDRLTANLNNGILDKLVRTTLGGQHGTFYDLRGALKDIKWPCDADVLTRDKEKPDLLLQPYLNLLTAWNGSN